MLNRLYVSWILNIYVLLQAKSSWESAVCYRQRSNENCFSNNTAFQGLPLPGDPTGEIAPSYHLYRGLSTAMPGYVRRVITSGKELGNLHLGVTVIVPGWMGDFPNTEHWQLDMIKNILKLRAKSDVLLVEWSKGAALKFGHSDPFLQSAANSRSIAWTIGNFLLENEKFDAAKGHCIGFSIGAHVCGFVGKRFRKCNAFEAGWARISGLDPSFPHFDFPSLERRLDKSDATFVDIIHTSRLGLERAIGHVDFYVFGGNYQPGCSRTLQNRRKRRHLELSNFIKSFTLGIQDLFVCSHFQAPLIYSESITVGRYNQTCSFEQFCPCKSRGDYNYGRCSNCDRELRQAVGYWAYPSKGGNYFGELAPNRPFCLQALP